MRSRAHFRGHPIHASLVSFPFAFLTGAFLFDLAGWWTGWAQLSTTGATLSLAGIATGLVAAIPGLLDFRYTVPPRSSGKSRAAKHGLLNVTVLVLFALAWWLRGAAAAPVPVASLGLELVGAGLLGLAGWMGGTLVSRNQIGVDHRYAGAGKWKEEAVQAEPGGFVLAQADELKTNQMKLLRANGRRIVLARDEKGFVAFEDRCPHKGGSLAGGAIMCGTVQCPWHGSQFDVRTGALKEGPAKTGIGVFQTEQHGHQVKVMVS